MGVSNSKAEIEPDGETGGGDGSAHIKAGRWVLAATILGVSMAYIDGTAVNVALPELQNKLGATITDAQWVIESYQLFLAALILVGGALGDRYGRRLIYGLGAALFALSSVLCGFAQNVDQLIAFRAIQGVGGAMLIPGSLAIVTVFFDPSERGRAIGTWSAFAAITTAIGPVLGGWLIENVSWRWIFFINAPITVAVLGILIFRVPESKGESSERRIDYRGAVLATAGLAGIVYGLIESSNVGFLSPYVLAPLILGMLAFGLFIYIESTTASPMIPLRLFRSPTFTGANLITFLLYGALGGVFFFLPFALIQVYGYSATGAGATLLPIIALLFALSRWAGGLADRYGAKVPMIIGPAVGAVGYVLIALLQGYGSFFVTFFPGIIVLGIGLALSVAPLTTAVMNAVHVNYSGTASGINNAVSRVAALVAIAVLGIIVLHAFNSHLDLGMEAREIPQAVRDLLDAERIKLAGAEIPPELGPEMKAALEGLVKESYIGGFKLILYLSAVVSLICSFIAWALIRNGRVREEVSPEG
jgi:EmrB/QacA subfamily drug resistance transporter